MKTSCQLLLLLAIGNMQEMTSQNSPFINRVFEFRPAPSQFMHEIPFYEGGETEDDMRELAELYLANNAKSMICLGAFGGYITVGFDHTIANVEDEYDFQVLGNAFYADANPSERPGGSCEPGVIQVSYDRNKNGMPDDKWYEIAGSEYRDEQTIKEYQITYYRPDPNKKPILDPSQPHISDMEYIKWTDNQGQEGHMPKNVFHTQSYFPEWIEEDQITFSGTRLPNNGVNEGTQEDYYVLYAYDFGYADNHPNNREGSKIKIDWAVDEHGDPANLPGVDFIRIHSGVHQYNGWLGECSTEILGITDLHPETDVNLDQTTQSSGFTFYLDQNKQLHIKSEYTQTLNIYSLSGGLVYKTLLQDPSHEIDLSSYMQGVYLLKTESSVKKLIVNQ